MERQSAQNASCQQQGNKISMQKETSKRFLLQIARILKEKINSQTSALMATRKGSHNLSTGINF